MQFFVVESVRLGELNVRQAVADEIAHTLHIFVRILCVQLDVLGAGKTHGVHTHVQLAPTLRKPLNVLRIEITIKF